MITNRKRNLALGFGVVAAAGIAGSAFAAAITAAGTNAGVGVSTPAGYTVTNVKFTSTATAGGAGAANAANVLFNISPGTASHTVFARANGSGNWVTCSGTTTRTCTLSTALSGLSTVQILAFKSA